MNTTHGALFDLDGVLVDSEGEYTRFWAMIGTETNQPSPTFAYDIKGTNLRSILTTYFAEELHQPIVDRIHSFESEMDLPLYERALELVDELRECGWHTAVFTSSDTSKMNHLYECHPDFCSHFDAIVTGDMVEHSKPHPEGYIKAARLIGLEPDECVVFEDSIQGLQAGRASSARVVALTTGNPYELVSPLADRVYGVIGEIEVEHLNALFS